MAQMVKNLPAMQETQVQSLGQQGPLEKEMATHSSILNWRILWTEEPQDYSSQGHKESDITVGLTHVHVCPSTCTRIHTHTHTHTHTLNISSSKHKRKMLG